VHYLALLERKIGALDQAAPLVGWTLPDEFATLRRLLEARLGKPIPPDPVARQCRLIRPGRRTAPSNGAARR